MGFLERRSKSRHVLIGGGYALTAVYHEYDDVGVSMASSAGGALSAYYIVLHGLDTACVHQRKMVIQPFRVAVDSVAGDARRILYYGDALADYLIEEGGFSNVRAAYYRHKWL